MKRLLLTSMIALTVLVVQAQNRTVSGRIVDDTGEALIGASVTIKGTSSGTVTDIDGNFSLSVPDGAVLVVSYVGYATQEITVGSQTSIDVTMESDAEQLGEVVVIGYGTQSVKDATGAVTAVSSKDFNGGIISSPEQLIQGKTAGVQITSASGNPGDGIALRIRGTNSVRSNNNPLFVVDGVPLAGGETASSADVGLGTTGDTNPLNFLDPSDIESISILKDASAAAIYGSRGANGVVFITTKNGKGLGDRIEFSSSVSISKAARTYDLLKADDEPYYLSGVGQYGGDARANDFGANTDWQEYIFRTAVSHKQNVSYSTTIGDATTLRASIGYEDQNGIMRHSSMQRITGRINGSTSFLNDDLTVSLTSSFSNVKREDPALSGSAGFRGDILGAAYAANPTWPADPDFNNTGGLINPANLLKYYDSRGIQNRILVNPSVEYKIMDGLVAKLNYGLDFSDADRVTLISGLSNNVGNNVTGNGLGQLNNNRTLNHLVEATVTYNKSFGSVDMEILGGYSVQSFKNTYNWVIARGFSDFKFEQMESDIRDSFDAADAAASSATSEYNNWGISNDITGGDETSGGFAMSFPALTPVFFSRPAGVSVNSLAANFYDRTDYLQSYFSRANFTISGKYLITATVRVDGSSTFGDNNKYGVFPSGAFAWQLHEESFVPDFFNTLKLRVGYGVVGNQDGLGYGNFVRRERAADVSITENGSIGIPGTLAQGQVNPNLKWEETTQQTIGFDFGFFGERVFGSLDFYKKETSDLLLTVEVAAPALVPTRFENLDAIVENKGWELELGFEAIESNDVSLTISGNVSQNKNMLRDFNGNLNAGTIYGQGLSGAFAQQLTGGRPLFSYYLREFAGFDAEGQPIRDDQKFVNKSALPEWNAGLSINLVVGDFDFSAYAAGQFGFWIYNNTQNAFFTAGSINTGRNVTADVLTSGESGAAEAAVSERFLHKGDFIRMQNVSVGYNVPVDGASVFKNLRFSLNVQNLFLITDYNGIDPEVSTQAANFQLLNNLPTAGIDWAAYPRPRTFTLGLNATF